ncbi:hypothetical protein GR702_21840 [Novosphingobium sp. FGD1]|uniref:Uncharacterized protein n=1 Tax=Novosphingobium silvae TaxID=2692619 RepID=A0A7X4K9K9_9SPHN|nr:hypothetical protein [Novosphingobium silvae]MYM00376.1 hypothetical protein [Novosphingobium silvae]
MARPILPEDRFTSRALAIAGELSPRNVALLIDHDLAPAAVEGGGGRGGHRTFNSVAVGAIAMIGAFHKAGMELLVAARLAGAMTEEYAAIYGRLPSNLGAFLHAPFNLRSGHSPWSRELPKVDFDDDYWLHNRLRLHTTIYKPWTALRGDMVVEIVDQTYVLTRFHDLNFSITSPVSDPLHSSPEYRIKGRGNEARIMPIHEGIQSFDFSVDKESADALRERQAAYLHAHENAVTRLRVNVGLAIRNGLDRIADDRMGRTDAA